MKLLLEVIEGYGEPFVPDDGWNVGHLANLGVLLSCDGFATRLDLHNLNMLFDFVESGEEGEVRDHEGRILEIRTDDKGVVLTPRDDLDFPNGLRLDLKALKEMGIEQYEEEVNDDPDSEFTDLGSDVTVDSDEYEPLEEGVKRAYRRVGKKIKRGFRVTSGFRKGRVVSSAKAAYKPRKPASTRMKLKLAARKKKIIRILKGKRTRRKPSSQRLVRMNKSLK